MANNVPGKPAAVLATFYSPPPFAGSAVLDINGVGVREWMNPGLVDRIGKDDVLLMVFHQDTTIGVGADSRGAGGSDVLAPAGSLMAWRPRAPQRYGCRGRPWLHSWIHATGTVLDHHLRVAGLPRDVPITGVDPLLVESACHAIHQELTAHALPDPLIIENTFSTLIRQAARAVRGAGTPAIPAELLAVRRHLDAHFHQQVSIAHLARTCGWSAGHFCTRFKAAFGMPAVDLVVRLRLGRARALLRDPAVTVAQAARAVGYDDPRTFARLVRRHLGCGPSALRH